MSYCYCCKYCETKGIWDNTKREFVPKHVCTKGYFERIIADGDVDLRASGPGAYNPYWCEYGEDDEQDNGYQSPNSGCFLVTACFEYKKLPRDCPELEKARSFRDKYIIQLPKGKELIDDYYKYAPIIVEQINKDQGRADVYRYIYEKLLLCDSLIDKGLNESALKIYFEVYNNLKERFVHGEKK